METKPPNTIRSLAIETSGRLGSVALGLGPTVTEARTFRTTQRHAAELLPTVDALCREHQVAPPAIDEVYVSAGPGSFTGLRIGITFARSLALAHGVKTVRVPTLDVIAQNALHLDPPPKEVAVILDAKRNHIYAAQFTLSNARYVPTQLSGRRDARDTGPRELDPDTFLAGLPRGAALLGEGIAWHRASVERAGLTVLPEELNRARAEVLHRIGFQRARQGRFDDPSRLVPIYIRRPEAEEIWERKHGPQ